MKDRVDELLKRRPSRWGNVDMKTFGKDIRLLTTTIKDQRLVMDQVSEICEKALKEKDMYQTNLSVANEIRRLINGEEAEEGTA